MEKKICKVDGCNNNHFGLGFCQNHHKKFKRYGDPLAGKINHKHGKAGLPEYIIWQAIKTRCYNKNHTSYKHYGGRGITVCDRWLHSFPNFLKDMGEKPFPEAQIDRENNNEGYCKYNCGWTTPAVNIRNSSIAKLTMQKVRDIRSKYKLGRARYKDLAEEYNICLSSISKILTNQTWKETNG